MLTREKILQAKDVVTEEVMIPEWGDSVLVRGMTGIERDRFEAAIIDMNGKKIKYNLQNARARLVRMTCVDAEGKLIFSDADIAALGGKNAAAIDRIYEVAARLSGISDEDMEELTKTRRKPNQTILFQISAGAGWDDGERAVGADFFQGAFRMDGFLWVGAVGQPGG